MNKKEIIEHWDDFIIENHKELFELAENSGMESLVKEKVGELKLVLKMLNDTGESNE